MPNKRLIDMTEAFSPEGIEKLRAEVRKKIKPVLRFDYEGSDAFYQIRRVTKDGKVYGRRIIMLRPEELKITDKEKG